MPPENNPSRFSSSKALFTVLVVILIGAGLGLYLSRWKKNNTLQQSNFSPQTQFVPKGAESREVDQVLLSFGLPTTPPFFDKKKCGTKFGLDCPDIFPNSPQFHKDKFTPRCDDYFFGSPTIFHDVFELPYIRTEQNRSADCVY